MGKTVQRGSILSKQVRIFFYFFLLANICFSTFVNAEEVPSLFVTNTQEKAASSSSGQVTRNVTINKETLELFSSGALNAVRLNYAGNDTVFYKNPSSTPANVSWSGKDTYGDNELLITAGQDHLFARVLGQNGEVVFRPGVTPYEAVQVRLDPSKKVPLVEDGVPVSATASVLSKQGISALAADAPTQIDVMVLYTPAMAAAYPGHQIITRIQYFIDLTNISFANSGINTSLRLVHSQQVNYPDDSIGDMSEALDTLTLNNGVFAGLENLRTEHGADQVTLLRRFVDEGCGLAWVLTGSFAPFAYSVVHDGVKTDNSGFYCSDLTYAHELGHNLGSAHDRLNSFSPGIFSYSYGYQAPANQFHTVMSYPCFGGCPEIAHFSNPNVSYQGNVTGIAEGQPNSADNAKSMNQTRAFMSSYRTATK